MAVGKRIRRWAGPLFALAALSLVLLPAPASLAGPGTDRHLRVEAGNFAYEPGTLDVNPGDRVTLELVATDVAHGLHVDGYGVDITADPGQTARVTFVADRPGTFRFRCSVTCGALHPFMIGKLNVGTNWLYWRAAGLAVLAGLAGLWWVRR